MNNDPVFAKNFWNSFIHITVETLYKPASRSNRDPAKSVDLDYEYPLMQQLMDSQLKDPSGRTPTKREIKERVKTQLQRLLPNIAENLTFNSLSLPGSFKTGFYSRKPYEETGSWYSLLYQGTNQAYSNNLKGIFELYNEEIDNHNQKVLAKTMKDKTDYDNQIIPKLKEHKISRSHWTRVIGKGNLLASIKKGVFTSWPEMNASKKVTNVPKNADKW